MSLSCSLQGVVKSVVVKAVESVVSLKIRRTGGKVTGMDAIITATAKTVKFDIFQGLQMSIAPSEGKSKKAKNTPPMLTCQDLIAAMSSFQDPKLTKGPSR